MKRIFILVPSLFISFACHAATLTYCKNVKMSGKETRILHNLIVKFASDMHCKIASNCITQWDVKKGFAKYSVAWKHQCGPVIDGQHQLGDEGNGSTFVCEKMNGKSKICCWPLGYNYVMDYVKCL